LARASTPSWLIFGSPATLASPPFLITSYAASTLLICSSVIPTFFNTESYAALLSVFSVFISLVFSAAMSSNE